MYELNDIVERLKSRNVSIWMHLPLLILVALEWAKRTLFVKILCEFAKREYVTVNFPNHEIHNELVIKCLTFSKLLMLKKNTKKTLYVWIEWYCRKIEIAECLHMNAFAIIDISSIRVSEANSLCKDSMWIREAWICYREFS